MSVGLTTRMTADASPAALADATRDASRRADWWRFRPRRSIRLGADAGNAGAIVARLYQAKGRPSFDPLIATVGDLGAARQIAVFDARALELAEAFWPGPLTLVLPRAPHCAVADLATAGLDTVAVRVPAHPVARALLRAFGGAVVAPSANLSGHVSPTHGPAHVARSDLKGRIDIILDGGAVAVGVDPPLSGWLEHDPMLLRRAGCRM